MSLYEINKKKKNYHQNSRYLSILSTLNDYLDDFRVNYELNYLAPILNKLNMTHLLKYIKNYWVTLKCQI